MELADVLGEIESSDLLEHHEADRLRDAMVHLRDENPNDDRARAWLSRLVHSLHELTQRLERQLQEDRH